MNDDVRQRWLSGEEMAAGASPGEGAASAFVKVRAMRAANGLDPSTGLPAGSPAPAALSNAGSRWIHGKAGRDGAMAARSAFSWSARALAICALAAMAAAALSWSDRAWERSGGGLARHGAIGALQGAPPRPASAYGIHPIGASMDGRAVVEAALAARGQRARAALPALESAYACGLDAACSGQAERADPNARRILSSQAQRLAQLRAESARDAAEAAAAARDFCAYPLATSVGQADLRDVERACAAWSSLLQPDARPGAQAVADRLGGSWMASAAKALALAAP